MNHTSRTILLIPSVRRGNGTGHLRRCIETADVLESVHGACASLLVTEDGPSISAVDAILSAFPHIRVNRDRAAATPDLAVLDRRETQAAYVDELKKTTMVVGVDEGGEARGYCDYLIDTLPTTGETTEPNRAIQAARAPKNRRLSPAEAHESILITFGGEDPAGLTQQVCVALLSEGVAGERITVVRGPSAPRWPLADEIPVLENEMNLREILYKYDLVITSFGLTAFEALSAGVGVLLVNPTPYHTRLSDDAGFPCAGTAEVDGAALMTAVFDPPGLRRRISGLKERLLKSGWNPDADGLGLLADALSQLSTEGSSRCPVCGNSSSPSIARTADRSFFCCECTGLIFQRSFAAEKATYNEEYFNSEYQAQYGRTYLEDFKSIQKLARPRLRSIARIIGSGAALLDVGCAYGPFLEEARRRGFSCYGTDISKGAVDYVTSELGIQAVQACFPEFDPLPAFGRSQFAAVTMWYVIEHFADLDRILTEVAGLVAPGGVFGFSTPNYRGISGRRSLGGFLDNSPSDHFSIWSPRVARKILKRYGFTVRSIRVTGHHPERFPGMAGAGNGFLTLVVLTFSRLFGLGDTFEVFAVQRGAS